MQPPYSHARPVLVAAARAASSRGLLPYDEALSEAHLVWVESLHTYRPGRTTFVRHLRYRLRKGLLAAARRERRQRHGLTRDHKSPVLRRVASRDVPGREDWSDGLSEPATRMVRLAVSSAPGLRPREVRRMIAAYFLDLGYGVLDVLKCFREIKGSLP